ncbi:alpha/beta hydrolase [Anaerostipes butyraticus]|uniref:alpha/beta hydrolase n=1 Tax=Anaerostipes butyraticus TaxID=645466 RepID=UPI0032080BA5
MNSFTIDEKKVTIYQANTADAPVIYLNTVMEEGNDKIYEILKQQECPEVTLITISGLDWNHDMTPWDAPPISKNAEPCTGGADEYLNFMTKTIVPEAERRITGKISWRGLAGYSLAGLFAVYALYQTDLFSRAASISGSLWFPGIIDYVFSHEMAKEPECIYFSVGSKESRTRNPYMKTVRKNTEQIERFYREKGIQTVFQLNPGNHFQNAAERTAAGIGWLLTQQKQESRQKY